MIDLRSHGWYAIRLTQASEVPTMRGLAIPATTPVLLATYRCPAPWPDIQAALPLDDDAARGWIAGDRETCALVGLELAQALQRFLETLKTGNDPDEVN